MRISGYAAIDRRQRTGMVVVKLALLSIWLALPMLAQQPGTLTLPAGTVCATNAEGRQVCVMPEAPGEQQPRPPAPPPKCPSFYAAGVDYTLNGSPKWTGWAAVATLLPGVQCDPKSGFQPHLVAQHVAKFEKVNGVETIVATSTMNIALPIQKLGPINAYVLGGLGPAVAGSTSSVHLGSAYGAVATIPLKWGILATPAIEWVNGTRSFWLGFGRTFSR